MSTPENKEDKTSSAITEPVANTIAGNEHVKEENTAAADTGPTETAEKKSKVPGIILVEKALLKKYNFRRNAVTTQKEYKMLWEDKWTRVNEHTVHRYLQYLGFRWFHLSDLVSLLNSNFVTDYHPFETYFKSLPEWDGKTDYIKKLASYIKAEDQSFYETQLKKFMVRTIRCALEAGKPNRTVLVFYGGQDLGKSWYIRFFNPFGSEYYSESPLRGDSKDSWLKLTECYLINLEELADLSLVSVNRLKQFISIAWVKERRPYAVEEIPLQRRCSFMASTNRPEFLIDTQNTRWLIIKISAIDRAYSKEFNIHDAWAQAWALYRDTAFDCELNEDEQKQRDAINQQFEVVSPEHDAVVRYLKPCKEGDEGAQFMTKAEIIDWLHKETMLIITGDNVREIINPIKLNPHGVIQALTKEHFTGGRKYINGKQHRGYFVILVPLPKVLDTQTTMVFNEKEFFPLPPPPLVEPLKFEATKGAEDKKSAENDKPLDMYEGL
ncbi:MAG: VapE domain-containing protein [Bacteroidia bacterium]